jgi:hypothetical protein
MHDSNRRYLYDIKTTTLLAAGDQVMLPANPRRVGLILSSADPIKLNYVFYNFGRPAWDGTNFNGLAQPYIAPPLVLDRDIYAECIREEIHVAGQTAGTYPCNVTCIQILCDCDLRDANPTYDP